MNILITGGAGFIGTKITERLIGKHNIIIFDNFLKQIHGDDKNLIDGVSYVIGDVAKIEDWEAALQCNPDIIFHLAAETGTEQSMYEVSRYVKTNILGTSLLIDFINSGKYKTKKVILSSSRAVYGDHGIQIGDNLESITDLNPMSIYGTTKLVQEELFKKSSKIPYTIFRYQNVYGPGQSLKNPYTGIVSIFSKKFYQGDAVEVYDNGIPTRDFIYVDDVVDATLMAIDNTEMDSQIYNVGSGVSTSILEMSKLLRQRINLECDIKITNHHRLGDIMHAKANTDKLTKMGWKHSYSLEEGVSMFVDWFEDERLGTNGL